MEREQLKALDFEPLIFSMFSIDCKTPSLLVREIKLYKYFYADYSIDVNLSKRLVKLDDVHYSASQAPIFKTVSEELKRYNDKKYLEKIAVKENGIYFCKNLLVLSFKLNLLGHLSKTLTS